MTNQFNKELLKKLKHANVVCRDCGDKYGIYSVAHSSMWHGTCHVCDNQTFVTEARDFAYFITGIRRLKLEEIYNKQIDEP